ncbi:hypothetical protein QTP88_013956 [Uroleucon formosanum]
MAVSPFAVVIAGHKRSLDRMFTLLTVTVITLQSKYSQSLCNSDDIIGVKKHAGLEAIVEVYSTEAASRHSSRCNDKPFRGDSLSCHNCIVY